MVDYGRRAFLAAACLAPLLANAAQTPDVGPSAFIAGVDVSELSASDRELMKKSLSFLWGTPTGRPLADAFVAQKVRARLAVKSFSSPSMFKNGSGFVGLFGQTSSTADPMIVTINQTYLEWARAQGWEENRLARAVAGFLAHEMLGHVLEGTLARRAGVFKAFTLYEGNELNALLVGWLTEGDLGVGADDSLLRSYLASPDSLRTALIRRGPDYAVALPLDELRMAAAFPYVVRLGSTEEARRDMADAEARNSDVMDLVRHFAVVHRPGDPLHRSAESMSDLRHDGEVYRDSYFPAQKKQQRSIEASLTIAKTILEDPVRGKEIARQAQSRDFDVWEAAIARNSAELRRRFPSKTDTRAAAATPSPRQDQSSRQPPPTAGFTGKSRRPFSDAELSPQVSMEQLVELYHRDLAEHPEHWGVDAGGGGR